MDKFEEAMLILAEECAELQQECFKQIRFKTNDENRKRFVQEICDVLTMIDLISKDYCLDITETEIEKGKFYKTEKLLKYSNLFD